MKKIIIIVAAVLLIALITMTVTLAETGLKKSDETLEQIDRKIEMYESGR